jgi:hypothetical protein
MFVKDVAVTRDKGLAELLLAPYTFVNAGIAPVYGVAPPASGFQRVDLDPTQRAGILTQVGFLAAYADGAQPQTILRGAFVNRDILCADLPPPPDAFTLPPVTGTTNRQRVETATNTGACAACHVALINPPGFALEQYDAIGKFRTTDNGKPVDATGSYAFDGMQRSFNGGVELSKLVAGSQQAHDCYSRNWLEYAYGRLIDREVPADKSLVAQLGARSSKGGYSVKALLMEMVATDAFVTRSPGVSP